jgi:hypothetical protein
MSLSECSVLLSSDKQREARNFSVGTLFLAVEGVEFYFSFWLFLEFAFFFFLFLLKFTTSYFPLLWSQPTCTGGAFGTRTT